MSLRLPVYCMGPWVWMVSMAAMLTPSPTCMGLMPPRPASLSGAMAPRLLW